MKFLALALILTFFGGSFAGAQTIEPEVREKVLGAYHEAIEVLNEYSKNPQYKPQYRETTRLMAELLDKADFGFASEKSMGECIKDPKMEAGTGLRSQTIMICPYGLSLSKNQLIQTFIHESYHLYEGKYYYRTYKPDLYKKFLANDFDMTRPETRDSEKRATIMELEIMLKTYGCVYSTSGYFRPLLGLVENKDYTICK
jgi:hypothetical protein